MIIPRIIHLASAALPAAGAFTAQTLFDVPPGMTDLTFYVTYTRGAVGGFPAFRLQTGNGIELSRPTLIDGSSLAIVQPDGTVTLAMAELVGPTPSGAGAIDFTLEYCIKQGVTQLRLTAAEAGVEGTPGTMQITLTGGG